jgi:hypothetical protein
VARVANGTFSAEVEFDTSRLFTGAVRHDKVSSVVEVCGTVSTGKDDDGRPRQSDAPEPYRRDNRARNGQMARL